MVVKFEDESLESALDRSLRNATHLRARDAAAVKAARELARKIDAWSQIVDWALEDAAEDQTRPAVPANDNVSLASFLKYLDALGLLPAVQPAGKSSSAKAPVDQLQQFRDSHFKTA